MSTENSIDLLLAELTSGDEARAEAAACSLAEVGEPVLPQLETLLHSEDVDHRWWAVRTLGQMNASRVDWLIQALADPAAEVRAAAALALAAHPEDSAAPALARALDDEDNVVAVLAVSALVSVGKNAVPAVLDEFPRSSQRGRIQGMRALAELRDHSAIPLMMKAIEEDSAMLRYWAEQGLNGLGLDMVYIKPE